MANLNRSRTNDVTSIDLDESDDQITLFTGVDVEACQMIQPDPATGLWRLASSTTTAKTKSTFMATRKARAGEPVTGVREGVVDSTHDLSGLAWNAPVYLSDTDGELADAAGTNTLQVGFVIPVFASGTGNPPSKIIKLDIPPNAREAYTGTTISDLLNAVADPGNAGAIPVVGSGVVPIVTAGAETRTLAAPTATGQEIIICMKTDGGDCVITCATLINQAGNNTITLNDAGDSIRLNAIQVGNNKRWRVVYNDGCVLSTV